MCNTEVKRLIVDRLAEAEGGRVVSRAASYRELKRLLGIDGSISMSQFKRALGSAVRDGWVVWCRPGLEVDCETRTIALYHPDFHVSHRDRRMSFAS